MSWNICGLRGGIAVVLAVFSFAGAAQQARAELLVGLTSANGLISFDSATPGLISSIGTVTGLTSGDTLVGIDRRPQALSPSSNAPGAQNNLLYALGVNFNNGGARVYTLSETNAAATLVSTLAADPADTTAPFPFTAVTGFTFGIDFDPTVDRLRVTSETGQNLRINVDNGSTQLDVPLAYIAGDANFGDAPVDTAVAYANNFGGATSTSLRGVDVGQSPDTLVLHVSPNDGTLQTLTTLIPLGINSVAGLTAYDVSGLSGTPYFSFTPVGSPGSSLLVAIVDGQPLTIGAIGGGSPLVGIAAPVGAVVAIVPEPSSLLLFTFGAATLLAYARRRQTPA